MTKKIVFSSLILAFVLSISSFGIQAQASTSHYGQLVKMSNLSSLYYVAADGKRYVFPNINIYNSWFSGFDEVITLSEEELTALPLGGNVLYRPGVLLVKITTDPKVYAVSKGGILRWVKTEAIARALYGNNWNMLIDDVPDSFFTNYKIGDVINSISDFDPEEEADDTDSIDANRGLALGHALRAHSRKCQIVNNARNCWSNSNENNDSDDEDYSDDDTAPYIKKITVSNSGNNAYINAGDKIAITFSEAIDPKSINSELEADDYFSSLEYDITGAINVYSDGIVEIKDIAKFDIGSVENTGQFSVKLDLSLNADVLTITLLSGNSIEIEDEDFERAEQIGDTVTDRAGNAMEDDSDIGKPSGTFGGENVNDGIEPFISSIKVYNNGSNNYIDVDDEIRITFSEEIDPESVNNDLYKNGSVDDIDNDETGGVNIDDDGILTITDIASFFVGNVDDDGEFDVSLALNSAGTILTITLASGDDIRLEDEDLDDAEQIGDTIEDRDGNEMDDDPNINDPTGTFVGDSSGSDLYIDYIKAYDNGYVGYVDINDTIVITFSQAVDPESIDARSNIEFGETGGVYINSSGLLTVTDILSFDIGSVEETGEFIVDLSLSSSHKVLTVTIVDGDAIKITKEVFSDATQIGGFMISEEDDTIVMDTKYDIDNPTGTFGGDSAGTSPYIADITIENGSNYNYIDTGDKITITFSEAIDPDSIDNSLELDDYIDEVDDDDTGGVIIKDNGMLTISDIAKFYVGNVDDDGEFEVRLDLNEIGNVLTITLQSGDDVEITYEDLDDAEQTGGTIEDEDGNKMEDDPKIDDPNGSF